MLTESLFRFQFEDKVLHRRQADQDVFEVFRQLADNLTYSDPFLVLADYASYIACQEKVDAAWKDTDAWTRMSILNTARSGKFSSDRAIKEYCDEIWNVMPVNIKL